MKKLIIFLIILTVAVGPLFKGLFFPYEMYLSFIVLSILCAAYIVTKLVQKDEFVIKERCIYLCLILLFAYLFSFVKAINIRGNIEAIIQFIVYFLVFYIVFDYFRTNKEKIPPLYYVPLAGIGFLSSIVGLVGYTGVFPELEDTVNWGRIGSTLQYANTAAIYYLILIVFIISLIINNRNIIFKALLAGAGNIMFMTLFFTSSRGVFLVVPVIVFLILIFAMPNGYRLRSFIYVLCITVPILAAMQGYDANSEIGNLLSAAKWVAFSAGISAVSTLFFSSVFTIKTSKPFKYCIIGLTMVVVIIATFIKRHLIFSLVMNNIPEDIIARIKDINFSTDSVIMRFEFYIDAWRLIKDNWMFGLGGGGFASLYQSVQNVYYAARLAHNHYLQVFVEAGIIGALSFAAIAVLACIYFLITRVKEIDIKQKIYITAGFCSFLSLALHSAIDFNLSYASMSLIFWSLIGISAAYFNNVKAFAVEKKNLPVVIGIVKKAVSVFAIILCISISVTSYFLHKAAYYTSQGAAYKMNIEPDNAIESYEKAVKFDRLNANNYAELADLYYWMSYTSETQKEKIHWMNKALEEGEKAIKLDRYYPYYNRILTNIYFYSEQYIKACEQAIMLVYCQPRLSGNYELLTKGYLEAGLQYIKENNPVKGKEYIELCTKTIEYPDMIINNTINFYRGKAFLLLAEYEEAENLLKKARGGSLELRMECDRLLYIINEETGRESENEKYSGMLYMGMVKQSPVYIDVKKIIASKVLQ